MVAAGVPGENFEQHHMQNMIKPGRQMLKQEVVARPVTSIISIDQYMQRGKTTLDERSDLNIACEGDIIIQSEESEKIPIENVRCRVDCYLFKENATVTNRCADTAIPNIQFKGVDSSTSNLQKDVFVGQSIGTYEH